jgi:hypothetical protein
MAGHLGALPADLAIVTIEVEEDVDGGPLRGAVDGPSNSHHQD